jgi:hypothetical protein
MVGKWKRDCLAANEEGESEYLVQGDTIRGVTRNRKGDVVSNYIIEQSSANYLGSTGEFHLISYTVTTQRPGKDKNLMVIIMETDFNKKRTLNSTRLSDGVVLVRDGRLVESNMALPYNVKCGS